MMKTGLQSHLLRSVALASVLGVGLVGCSDGSDSYFGWGDPGAWYESAGDGPGDPNLEGASVPADRLPEAEQAARGPGLDLGSADEGVEYADNDVRGSDSGTQGNRGSSTAPTMVAQDTSPLIAGARDLGATPPAPVIEPAEEKPTAAPTMDVASAESASPKKNYTAIPGTRTLSGMRPAGSAMANKKPAVDKDGNAIEIARLMDRRNADIPGPMPFAGNDGSVRGYPGNVKPAPSDLGEPVDVRTAEVKEPIPVEGDAKRPPLVAGGASALPAGPSTASAAPASAGGPRSIGQYLAGGEGTEQAAPLRAAPLKSGGGASALASSSARSGARGPLVPIADNSGATSLEDSMGGSFDQDYSAVAGRELNSSSVTVDMTALDDRKASVPQELIEDLNSEFGGDSSNGYTRSDLQFDGGQAPAAAPTMAVTQRRETLAALIPDQSAQGKQGGAYIPFGNGSVRLSAQDRAAITKLAGMVSGSNRLVHIIGHAADPSTDTHGGVQGFALSLERANKVAAALVAAGVPHTQLRVEARGVTGARRAELYIQ